MFSTRYDAAEKLWYGNNSPPLYNSNMNIAQVLLNSMTIFGPKIAQVRKKREFAFTSERFHDKTTVFRLTMTVAFK